MSSMLDLSSNNMTQNVFSNPAGLFSRPFENPVDTEGDEEVFRNERSRLVNESYPLDSAVFIAT